MSRDDGFAIADMDTGLFSDPKVVALARRLKDPIRTAATMTVYVAAVLESWASGARVSIAAAAPAWWLDDVDEVQADLAAVGLVDAEGQPTEEAWEHWYRPAFDRREKRRESGRQGGVASGHSRSAAEASPKRPRSVGKATLNPSAPTVPSVPSDPDSPRAPAAVGSARGETNGAAPTGSTGTCPRCDQAIRYGQPGVAVVDTSGQLGHVPGACPRHGLPWLTQ